MERKTILRTFITTTACLSSILLWAEEPIYTVTSEAQFMPFVYLDENNQSVGFDIDIMKAIAKSENLNLQFTYTIWEQLIPDIVNGKADIIASGMTITPERAQLVDFSNPYFDSEQLFLIRGSTQASSIDDMKPLTIAVQSGTFSNDVLKKIGGFNQVDYVKTTFLGVKQVLLGKADAVIADAGAMNYYKARYKDKNFQTLSAGDTQEQYGFAVKKGNTVLLDKLNKGLATIKSNGEYDRIYKQYFSE